MGDKRLIMKKQSKITILLWGALLLGLFWFQLKILFLEGSAEEKPAFESGQKAPDFTLNSLDGKSYHLQEMLKAKPVLLVFFSAESGPSRIEIMEFNDYLRKEKNPLFQALLVSDDSRDELLSLKQELDVILPILPDPSARVLSQYKVQSVPANFLIDQQGKLVFSQVGIEGLNVYRVQGLLKFQGQDFVIPERSEQKLEDGGTVRK